MTPETSQSKPSGEQPKLTDDLVDALAVSVLRTPAVDEPTPPGGPYLSQEDYAALDQVSFSDVVARITERKS